MPPPPSSTYPRSSRTQSPTTNSPRRQTSVKSGAARSSSRNVQGSVKTRVQAPTVSKLPQYDPADRGPEDRMDVRAQGRCWFNEVRSAGFSVYDPLVKGVMVVEGVNYSLYEAAKETAHTVDVFNNSLKEDIISEVGNGVRPDDIVIRVIPGQIKTVVLHYDTKKKFKRRESDERSHPQLVDAEWCMKIDYVIRTRDVQRQQNVAIALYTAFTGQDGFTGTKARTAYCRTIDKTCDARKILFSKPKEEMQQPQQPLPQQPALSSPPRPVHNVPVQPALPQPMREQAMLPSVKMMQGNYHQQPPVMQEQSTLQHLPVYENGVPMGSQPASVHSMLPAPPLPHDARLTAQEVAEKDRQLEQLELDIARERRALRSLQPNVVSGSPFRSSPARFLRKRTNESPVPPITKSPAMFLPSGSYIHEF